jgi:type IV secretory pathway VirB6-like protein
MLFYGKEIDFTFIILIVVFILAVYILFSYYQQQKQAVPIIVTSHSATTPTTVSIPEQTYLKNGAFALSLWIKVNSAVKLSSPSSLFNLLHVTKKNGTTSTSSSPLTLALDAGGNLVVSTTTTNTTIMLFPIGEPVNVVLNYNGDDDIDPDKSETVYDPTTNKNVPIYNPDANTFYNGSKRALDVYINGLLNNTISVDTLTNSKADPDSPPYITYMDASMNYVTTNGNQIVIGDDDSITLMDGTISNATFIKNGCSPQDVLNIFNQGQYGSILENLLSYKIRFGFIENNKEIKTYDFL